MILDPNSTVLNLDESNMLCEKPGEGLDQLERMALEIGSSMGV